MTSADWAPREARAVPGLAGWDRMSRLEEAAVVEVVVIELR